MHHTKENTVLLVISKQYEGCGRQGAKLVLSIYNHKEGADLIFQVSDEEVNCFHQDKLIKINYCTLLPKKGIINISLLTLGYENLN